MCSWKKYLLAWIWLYVKNDVSLIWDWIPKEVKMGSSIFAKYYYAIWEVYFSSSWNSRAPRQFRCLLQIHKSFQLCRLYHKTRCCLPKLVSSPNLSSAAIALLLLLQSQKQVNCRRLHSRSWLEIAVNVRRIRSTYKTITVGKISHIFLTGDFFWEKEQKSLPKLTTESLKSLKFHYEIEP